jgi:glycogen operon protein
MGRFPPGWAEWNDKFRDAVRSFWRGDAGAGDLSPRLCASADAMNHHGRKPWASVNFVTAHDGFTLQDLVSYNDKHNEANGWAGTDGTNDNRSSNCGVEGPTGDPAIAGLRRQQMRNMLATVLFAQGTPMLLAGDEFGRTQSGNNNAYCQDNETSWIDWESAAKERELTDFVRALIAVRHRIPLLRQNRYLTGEPTDGGQGIPGIKDVTWLSASGAELTDEQWRDRGVRCFGMSLHGRDGSTCLLIMNGGDEGAAWTLPCSTCAWSVVIDTSQPTAGTHALATAPTTTIDLPPHSLLLLEAQPHETRPIA